MFLVVYPSGQEYYHDKLEESGDLNAQMHSICEEGAKELRIKHHELILAKMFSLSVVDGKLIQKEIANYYVSPYSGSLDRFHTIKLNDDEWSEIAWSLVKRMEYLEKTNVNPKYIEYIRGLFVKIDKEIKK